jgi:hypothetical protein
VVKETFLEMAIEVQCDGFPKIFKDNSHFVSKLIWAFLCLIFTGLTCYLLTRNVLDFFRQESFYYEKTIPENFLESEKEHGMIKVFIPHVRDLSKCF